MAAVIEVNDLRRTYRTNTGVVRRRPIEVEAVRGISFSVGQGELFGLLGPNGAGKTTTIKMLITLLLPTGGEARVLGLDVVRSAAAGARAGSATSSAATAASTSGSRPTTTSATSPSSTASPDAASASGSPRWSSSSGSRAGSRSASRGTRAGMRQRLHIARGIIHDPEVVFLDEPTIGVDPVGARALRSTIAGLVGAGKTVLLTTHYMFEADTLCDRVAVIAHGRLVAQGTPRELKRHVVDRTVLEVEVFGIDEAMLRRLRTLPGVTSVSVEDRDQAQVLTIQSPHGLELTRDARRLPRRGADRPDRGARADPRGRLRGARDRGRADVAMRGYLRIVWVGLVLRVREFSVSRWFLLMCLLQPVIFASIAFYLFEAGGKTGDPAVRGPRRRDDGDLVVDPVRLRRRAAVEPLAGNARAPRRARRRRSSSCSCP